MGLFNKIKAAKATEDGKFIIPGNHVLKVSELKAFNGYGGETIVFEFEVVESTPDTGAIAEQQRQRAEGKGPYTHPKSSTYTPHQPGEKVSVVCKDANGLAGEMAMKNAKAILDTITGGHADDLDEDDFDALTGDAQIARGAILRCNAFDKPTKANDKMITRFSWDLIDASPAMTEAANAAD